MGKDGKKRRAMECGRERRNPKGRGTRWTRVASRGRERGRTRAWSAERKGATKEESMHATGPRGSERRGAHSEKRRRVGIREREEESTRGARGGRKRGARTGEGEEQDEGAAAEGSMRGESGTHENKRRRMGTSGQREWGPRALVAPMGGAAYTRLRYGVLRANEWRGKARTEEMQDGRPGNLGS